MRHSGKRTSTRGRKTTRAKTVPTTEEISASVSQTKKNASDNPSITLASILKREKVLLQIISVLGMIIVAIITGLFTYHSKRMELEHEDAVRAQENSYVQEFISTSQADNIATIPFVEYEMTSNPDLPGFDVYPYSYIKYTTEMGTKYLFLENQFSQIQYTTDKEGVCRMKRENTTGNLEALITSAYMQAYPDKQISVSSGCIVAIQYSSDRDLFVSLFELTNGNLPNVTDEELLNAITDYNNNPKGIDMLSFPHNTEDIISSLF